MKQTEIECRLKFFCFIVAACNFLLLFSLWAIYKMMNKSQFEIKDLIYLVIIAMAAYFIFQLNQELSGANSAIKTLDKDLENQKAQIRKEIDSIGSAVKNYKSAAGKALNDAARLQREREALKNEKYENDPYHITDADSLAGHYHKTRKSK